MKISTFGRWTLIFNFSSYCVYWFNSEKTHWYGKELFALYLALFCFLFYFLFVFSFLSFPLIPILYREYTNKLTYCNSSDFIFCSSILQLFVVLFDLIFFSIYFFVFVFVFVFFYLFFASFNDWKVIQLFFLPLSFSLLCFFF